jgi:hypothetical protein
MHSLQRGAVEQLTTEEFLLKTLLQGKTLR